MKARLRSTSLLSIPRTSAHTLRNMSAPAGRMGAGERTGENVLPLREDEARRPAGTRLSSRSARKTSRTLRAWNAGMLVERSFATSRPALAESPPRSMKAALPAYSSSPMPSTSHTVLTKASLGGARRPCAGDMARGDVARDGDRAGVRDEKVRDAAGGTRASSEAAVNTSFTLMACSPCSSVERSLEMSRPALAESPPRSTNAVLPSYSRVVMPSTPVTASMKATRSDKLEVTVRAAGESVLLADVDRLCPGRDRGEATSPANRPLSPLGVLRPTSGPGWSGSPPRSKNPVTASSSASRMLRDASLALWDSPYSSSLQSSASIPTASTNMPANSTSPASALPPKDAHTSGSCL